MDEDADVPRHPDVGMLRVLLGAPLRGGVGAQVNTYVYANSKLERIFLTSKNFVLTFRKPFLRAIFSGKSQDI